MKISKDNNLKYQIRSPKNNIWIQIRDSQAWLQIGDLTWLQIGDEIGSEIVDEINYQIWNQVRNQIGGLSS